jgi:hypothetical protein
MDREEYTVNEQWQRSGAKVAVYLRNHEALAAWLVHEDATKIILALDPERHHLRTVFRRDIIQLDVDHNTEHWIEPPIGAKRLERLREFEPTLSTEVEPALELVDYRRLRRNAKLLRRIATEATEASNERTQPQREDRAHVRPQALYEALGLSLDLFDELDRTRVLGIVLEHPQLVQQDTIGSARHR